MAVTMPRIQECNVANCSYNKNNECHALAIMVGSGGHPMCDTFTKLNKKGGAADVSGSVGACREDDCKYNELLECTANNIRIGMHSDHADCRTFVSR